MLVKRIFKNELMDDPSVPEERVHRALSELDVINTYLGGLSTTAKGLKKLAGKLRSEPVTILDVGAGGSRRFGSTDGIAPKVTCLDISESICHYRRERNPSETVLCGDARTIDFAESSFDIVHASLFLHHFLEEDIQELLGKFLRIAKCGVIINDLQRSGFALAGISILTKLFSRSDLVRHDGPLSVRRGFRRAELTHFCQTLPAASWSIEWSWAFRWLVVIVK
jgi:ubiquinone/menaquinone biosynthesis C-methylase UbiE